jgi:hypothetical protein
MSRDFDTLDLQRDPIGSVFLAHLDDLQAFKVYCENMAAATDYLQRIRAHDPSLNQFLKVCDSSLEICVQ